MEVKRNKKISFYKLPILVTGGTGFIGSHLVEALLDKKAHIVIPYIDIYNKSYFSVNKFSKQVTLAKCDIRDRTKLFSIVKKYKINYIFHLAAQTLVTEAYRNPIETLESNILGTANVLESARLIKSIKGVVVASSDKAYGKTKNKYTEESPLHGDHPYDVSKSSTDLIAQTYYKTYDLPIVITRFGNVYGEGDLHLDRIIPGICEAVIKNKPLKIRSDGSYIRDYLYVKDVVNGYLCLAENLNSIKGQAFNFSSADTYTVLNLLKKAEKIINRKIPFKILNNAVNEIPYQHLNDSKIKKLGWKNKYNFENTLLQTISWYKKNVF